MSLEIARLQNDVEQSVLGFSDSVSDVSESLLLIMKRNSLALESLTKTVPCLSFGPRRLGSSR